MLKTTDVLHGLTEDLNKVRNGEITTDQANSVARLTQVYINMLKLEISSGKAIAKIVGN